MAVDAMNELLSLFFIGLPRASLVAPRDLRVSGLSLFRGTTDERTLDGVI